MNSEKLIKDICALKVETNPEYYSEIVPLKDRRDYNENNLDFLERNYKALQDKDAPISQDLINQFTKRIPGKKASIIDFPNNTLCPEIWDSAEPSRLLADVRIKILADLADVLRTEFKQYTKWLSEVTLVGSMVTNQYNFESDLDINVCIDYDKFRETNEVTTNYDTDKKLRKFIRSKVYILNDKFIVGQHPTNYFVIGKGNRLESDAVYDVINNKWIVSPQLVPGDFNPDEVFEVQRDKALRMIRKCVKLILTIKMCIDDILRQHSSEKEIFLKDNIDALSKLQEQILNLRKIRFNKPNIELLSLGYSKNWEANNIVFKYIESYDFKKPLRVLINVLDDKEKIQLQKLNISLEIK